MARSAMAREQSAKRCGGAPWTHLMHAASPCVHFPVFQSSQTAACLGVQRERSACND